MPAKQRAQFFTHLAEAQFRPNPLFPSMRSPLLITRAMPNAQDNHGIVGHPIPQDIRPDRRHLPPPIADIAATMRKRR